MDEQVVLASEVVIKGLDVIPALSAICRSITTSCPPAWRSSSADTSAFERVPLAFTEEI